MVRTVTYVTDVDDAELVARAHLEVFGRVRPAATPVEVSRLIDPRMKVEIEVYSRAELSRCCRGATLCGPGLAQHERERKT